MDPITRIVANGFAAGQAARKAGEPRLAATSDSVWLAAWLNGWDGGDR